MQPPTICIDSGIFFQDVIPIFLSPRSIGSRHLRGDQHFCILCARGVQYRSPLGDYQGVKAEPCGEES